MISQNFILENQEILALQNRKQRQNQRDFYLKDQIFQVSTQQQSGNKSFIESMSQIAQTQEPQRRTHVKYVYTKKEELSSMKSQIAPNSQIVDQKNEYNSIPAQNLQQKQLNGENVGILENGNIQQNSSRTNEPVQNSARTQRRNSPKTSFDQNQSGKVMNLKNKAGTSSKHESLLGGKSNVNNLKSKPTTQTIPSKPFVDEWDIPIAVPISVLEKQKQQLAMSNITINQNNQSIQKKMSESLTRIETSNSNSQINAEVVNKPLKDTSKIPLVKKVTEKLLNNESKETIDTKGAEINRGRTKKQTNKNSQQQQLHPPKPSTNKVIYIKAQDIKQNEEMQQVAECSNENPEGQNKIDQGQQQEKNNINKINEQKAVNLLAQGSSPSQNNQTLDSKTQIGSIGVSNETMDDKQNKEGVRNGRFTREGFPCQDQLKSKQSRFLSQIRPQELTILVETKQHRHPNNQLKNKQNEKQSTQQLQVQEFKKASFSFVQSLIKDENKTQLTKEQLRARKIAQETRINHSKILIEASQLQKASGWEDIDLVEQPYDFIEKKAQIQQSQALQSNSIKEAPQTEIKVTEQNNQIQSNSRTRQHSRSVGREEHLVLFQVHKQKDITQDSIQNIEQNSSKQGNIRSQNGSSNMNQQSQISSTLNNRANKPKDRFVYLVKAKHESSEIVQEQLKENIQETITQTIVNTNDFIGEKNDNLSYQIKNIEQMTHNSTENQNQITELDQSSEKNDEIEVMEEVEEIISFPPNYNNHHGQQQQELQSIIQSNLEEQEEIIMIENQVGNQIQQKEKQEKYLNENISEFENQIENKLLKQDPSINQQNLKDNQIETIQKSVVTPQNTYAVNLESGEPSKYDDEQNHSVEPQEQATIIEIHSEENEFIKLKEHSCECEETKSNQQNSYESVKNFDENQKQNQHSIDQQSQNESEQNNEPASQPENECFDHIQDQISQQNENIIQVLDELKPQTEENQIEIVENDGSDESQIGQNNNNGEKIKIQQIEIQEQINDDQEVEEVVEFEEEEIIFSSQKKQEQNNTDKQAGITPEIIIENEVEWVINRRMNEKENECSSDIPQLIISETIEQNPNDMNNQNEKEQQSIQVVELKGMLLRVRSEEKLDTKNISSPSSPSHTHSEVAALSKRGRKSLFLDDFTNSSSIISLNNSIASSASSSLLLGATPQTIPSNYASYVCSRIVTQAFLKNSENKQLFSSFSSLSSSYGYKTSR